MKFYPNCYKYHRIDGLLIIFTYHRSLQQTLTELKDYQHKHEYWQTQQERLLRDQEIPQVRQEQRMGYEWHRTQFEEHVQSGGY